jgi:hypothetical protein
MASFLIASYRRVASAAKSANSPIDAKYEPLQILPSKPITVIILLLFLNTADIDELSGVGP